MADLRIKRAANTARRVRYPTLRPAARIVVSDPEGTVVCTKNRNLLRIVRVLAVRAARDDSFNARVFYNAVLYWFS
jgi:hypothetical protein